MSGVRTLSLFDLSKIEQGFAYEHASGLLDAECLSVEDDDGTEWLDTSDVTGEVDVYDAVAYLDTRHLLTRHPDCDDWVQICDESEPVVPPLEGAGSGVDALDDLVAAMRHPLNALVAAAEAYARKHAATLDAPYTVPAFHPNEIALLRRPRCAGR